MYKYILERAGEINWMALTSLFTFLFVFITAIILVLRKDKSHLQHMAELPLEEDAADLKKQII